MKLLQRLIITGCALGSLASAHAGLNTAASKPPRGDYIEARSASVYAGPCHYSNEYVTAGRTATLAWHFRDGAWQGVDLGGLNVVAVLNAEGNLATDSTTRRAVLYLDRHATPRQAAALESLFRRHYATTLGEVVATHRENIAITHDNLDYHVRVAASAAGGAPLAQLDVNRYPCRHCTQDFQIWYHPFIETLDEFLLERGNTATAFEWAQRKNEAAIAVRLALALYDPLHHLGFWNDADTMLDAAWEMIATTGGERKLHAALQLQRASLAHDTNDIEASVAGAEAALAEAREVNDVPTQAAALNLLGLLATDRGDNDAARQCFEESLALRQGSAQSNHHGRAIALHNLARLASREGNSAEAQRLYEQSLTHRRAGGDARGEAETLGNLGVLAQTAGDLARAYELYLQSLNVRRELRDRFGIALMLYNLAEVAEIEGQDPRAVVLFTHAERIFRELGSAFAAATADALQRLRENLGEDYALLQQQAEQAAWEDWVGYSGASVES